MKIYILAVPERAAQAMALWSELGGEILWDRNAQGAAWNHYQALTRIAENGERGLVIEDDAVLTSDFLKKVQTVTSNYPDRVVSFYLGTGRPVWAQDTIKEALASGKDIIELPGLYHGVCYSLTPEQAGKAISRLQPSECTDINIGYTLGESVIYTNPSLVDHLDGISIATDNNVARRAHHFEP